MHWYPGSVAEAVKLSKARDAIFVVFIEDNSDMSRDFALIVDSEDIAKKLAQQNHFLNIRIKSGSVDYTNFAQIYQFVPVPSIFFIGRKGTPLEVVCPGVDAADLAGRIDRIIVEHEKDGKEASSSLLLSEAGPSRSEDTNVPQPRVTKKVAPEYEVVCDGDVCVRKPKVAAEPEPSTSSQVSTEQSAQEALPENVATANEAVKHAKEMIEARKREKEVKERELAKQMELERRAVGQAVAEVKRWQADEQLKQIQEERKRERIENEMARKRILDQIAQDRAERKAKESSHVNKRTADPAPHANPIGDVVTARLNFKTPDGTTQTSVFDAGSTLADVRDYVAGSFKIPRSGFTLWNNFPRRELVDDAATVQALGLTPSAVVLVIRTSSSSYVADGRNFAQIFSLVATFITTIFLKPAQSFYNWILNIVSPRPPRPVLPTEPSPEPRQEPRQGLRYRPRTNVHRLTDDNEDDDNNTWNGNSTQQM